MNIPDGNWALILRARMQPPTSGHLYLIRECLKHGKVFLCLGQGFFEGRKRTQKEFLRAPFSIRQREDLIRIQLTTKENENLVVTPMVHTIKDLDLQERDAIQVFAGEEYAKMENGHFEGPEWIQTKDGLSIMDAEKSIVIPRVGDVSGRQVRRELLKTPCDEEDLKQLLVLGDEGKWKEIANILSDLKNTIREARHIFQISSEDLFFQQEELLRESKKD